MQSSHSTSVYKVHCTNCLNAISKTEPEGNYLKLLCQNEHPRRTDFGAFAVLSFGRLDFLCAHIGQGGLDVCDHVNYRSTGETVLNYHAYRRT